MAVILCLETTTTNCSVAISVNGEVVALIEDNNKQYSHAEKLHVFIEEALLKSGINKSELEAVAISKGPGSYTGLRIGVSAAKGLCFALDIPLISIATLESLAYQISEKEGLIIPMLDARRMEVYSAVFNLDKEQIRATEAEILNETSFAEYLEKGKVFFLGDGAEKFKGICFYKNAVFLDDKFPSASQMASLVEIKYKKNDIEDVAYFEPYYLKDFVTG
ncbi:MAG: tRNA (adenosine(37)-N6)-threonylcarbamoyltransferase complex dimerization subunit type 1 TsaB [Flavobacteriaceae bacterium]|nr:tRNA (adenosine(37)-N6)-threonylcarbamoyltransferase complex dimerization subunit type 1 TsaB [Flavobacteriaceae bacterium]